MMVSDVPQIIESCGFCRAEKVKSLRAMKSGMTNRSIRSAWTISDILSAFRERARIA